LDQTEKPPDPSTKRANWLYGPGPWIFTGLKLGTLVGVATLLGAETYVSTAGLEFEIILAMSTFNLVRAYVGMLAVALVVYALWFCLSAIEFALRRSNSEWYSKL